MPAEKLGTLGQPCVDIRENRFMRMVGVNEHHLYRLVREVLACFYAVHALDSKVWILSDILHEALVDVGVSRLKVITHQFVWSSLEVIYGGHNPRTGRKQRG